MLEGAILNINLLRDLFFLTFLTFFLFLPQILQYLYLQHSHPTLEWSPIQVLTVAQVAELQCSYGNWCFQLGIAMECGSNTDQDPGTLPTGTIPSQQTTIFLGCSTCRVVSTCWTWVVSCATGRVSWTWPGWTRPPSWPAATTPAPASGTPAAPPMCAPGRTRSTSRVSWQAVHVNLNFKYKRWRSSWQGTYTSDIRDVNRSTSLLWLYIPQPWFSTI